LEKMLRAVQKPGRYVGGERGAVIKDKQDVDLRFAFCFPDVYEIGMSHLGLKILYYIINSEPGMWCERAFAPWFDMRDQMIANSVPLCALESGDPLTDFDVVGFTLQYEMSYTNVAMMLDLAGIPLFANDRVDTFPLIVGGGPCACNPEPVADFFDIFVLGEAEEVIVELGKLIIKCKAAGYGKKRILTESSKIKGIYVPSLYSVKYSDDGTVKDIKPTKGAGSVEKRLITNFNDVPYPENVVVPLIETVHDRANVEVLRGCIRGCRFCQAGFIYRPFREKDVETLSCQAKELCDATGYEELSLVSLSTGDYTRIEELLDELLDWTGQKKISLSLPSLRIDSMSKKMADEITRVRKSGLTFAPEAGTQRLRDVINKNVTDKEILDGCSAAFAAGYTNVKLYFMIGLPTETDGDIIGIAELAQRIVDLYYSMPNKPKGRSVKVTVSCSCFVPKPFTPFQFAAQNSVGEFSRKQKLLLDSITTKKVTVNWHDAATSFIEAALARGDRRLSAVIREVYSDGGVFDSWDEGFSFERWKRAFERCGLDPEFYACRERTFDEVNPWDVLDYGLDKQFLISEYKKASAQKTTPNCALKCAACGIAKVMGGKCSVKR